MMMGKTANLGRLLVASALLAAALTPILPLTARGCSCATPSDLHEWVDQSEAVFVGTLIDKRDGGDGPFGMESVYVFEVEEWIKGDAGDVIEVHSASDGAGCGFEFFDVDQRTGAAIYLEGGVLRGGLCSQIDADVALTLKTGLVVSKTGIPRIVAGNGWNSTRLTVLDAEGGHVADFFPRDDADEFEGTQLLEACLGGDLAVQVTSSELVVWDMATFEPVAIHDLGVESLWGSDVSCRTEDASSIWLLLASDTGSQLVEVGATEPILTLPGTGGWVGTDFVLSQSGPEGDITWIDVASGEGTPITAVPPGELWSLSAAAHPKERRAALIETRFDQESTASSSTLSIVDEAGVRSFSVELGLEAYSPTWLDDERVLVTGYDWEVSEIPIGLVVDTFSGEVVELGPWNSIHNVAAGQLIFGVEAGSILRADLTSASVETLVTLPTANAGPLLVLEDAAAIETPTSTTVPATEPTVPPLVAEGTGPAPGAEPGSSLDARWIAGGTVVVFLGLLIWLAISSPRRPSDSS